MKHSFLHPVLKAWLFCKRGLAAMEFALVLPLMVTVTMGVLVIYMQGSATRTAQQTTATIADIMSRQKTISDQELAALGAAANALLEQAPGQNLAQIAMASVSTNETGNIDEWFIDWAIEYNSADEITLEEVKARDMPPMFRGKSIIVVRMKVEHTAALTFEGLGGDDTFIYYSAVKPRFVEKVSYENGSGG